MEGWKEVREVKEGKVVGVVSEEFDWDDVS